MMLCECEWLTDPPASGNTNIFLSLLPIHVYNRTRTETHMNVSYFFNRHQNSLARLLVHASSGSDGTLRRNKVAADGQHEAGWSTEKAAASQGPMMGTEVLEVGGSGA